MVVIRDPIIQAQECAFKAGIRPDEFWQLTVWEINQWIKARQDEIEDGLNVANMFAISIGWYSGRYNRMKDFPQNLSDEIDLMMNGPKEMSPEESAAHMINYLNAVTAYGGSK